MGNQGADRAGLPLAALGEAFSPSSSWKSLALVGLPASLRPHGRLLPVSSHRIPLPVSKFPHFIRTPTTVGQDPTNDLALIWVPLEKRSHPTYLLRVCVVGGRDTTQFNPKRLQLGGF